MINEDDIKLFKKYEKAPEHAFGGRVTPPSIVTIEEKEQYWKIFNYIVNSCKKALLASQYVNNFYVKSNKHSKERGARGNRPKDLWCAFRNNNSKDFNEMPQIYVIASHRGVEIGFAVSIPETDYSNNNVKLQNREIIPKIHKKLPVIGKVLDDLDDVLRVSNNWYLNKKTRLFAGESGFDHYSNINEMFNELKQEKISHGGGAICKIFTNEDVKNNPVNIEKEMVEAIKVFGDIQISCLPTSSDKQIIKDVKKLIELSTSIDFNPSSIEDGRDKKLRAVASRQGQKKFRNEILRVYNSKCAFTKCDVEQVLQAAHIIPYNGPKTNHIKNGILLRSDIHDLFDMFFISIDPNTLKILISHFLTRSYLNGLEGKIINLPYNSQEYPDKKVLEWHYEQFLKLNK